jgi:hypothetical protein
MVAFVAVLIEPLIALRSSPLKTAPHWRSLARNWRARD